jgi:hypothetical protein
MSNESPNFKYGEILFIESREFDKATINFTIVPEAYLVQEVDNPNKIYMFKTYKDMEDYFTDQTKGRY